MNFNETDPAERKSGRIILSCGRNVVHMEKNKCRCGAVVLAAGSGKRMGGSTKKQYLLMGGKPVLYYSLKAFEDSFVDIEKIVNMEITIED